MDVLEYIFKKTVFLRIAEVQIKTHALPFFSSFTQGQFSKYSFLSLTQLFSNFLYKVNFDF